MECLIHKKQPTAVKRNVVSEVLRKPSEIIITTRQTGGLHKG